MELKTLLFLLVSIKLVDSLKSYIGHKVYKAIPENEDEVKYLQDVKKTAFVEFWDDNIVVNRPVMIMVDPAKSDAFLDQMETHSIELSTVFTDVQRAIDEQLQPARNATRSAVFHGYSWDRYHNLEEIYTWLDELQAAYPGIVTVVNMGRSVENRDIRGVRINYKDSKLIGMLEGTLHAREWISPATVTWIIKEFLTSTDPEVRALAENFEWHIFPVVNPDGYVYTFTTHRMWRKNRSPDNVVSCAASGASDDMSHGVDLNRNFGFAWMTIGASDNPCSNTYAGPTAFSEPEARAIGNYVLNLHAQGELIYYIAFHSFTQLIIMPYSNVTGHDVLLNSNYGDMYEIAKRSADAIAKRFGTQYRVGVAADVLYPMSGSSFDWVKAATNVPVSYLVELRDLGEYGFLLPPDQIIPNNLEFMDGFIEMDRSTRKLGYYRSTGTSIVFSLAFAVLCAMFVTLFK